jgi:hypothetical protein
VAHLELGHHLVQVVAVVPLQRLPVVDERLVPLGNLLLLLLLLLPSLLIRIAGHQDELIADCLHYCYYYE